MIALWSLSAAIASPQHIPIEVCARFQTDFIDVAVGDFWPENCDNTTTCKRFGRGLYYEITDDYETHTGWLSDSDGCVSLTIAEVGGHPYEFSTTLYSKAMVNGIEIQSHRSDDWNDQDVESLGWGPVLTSALGGTYNIHLTKHQWWQNLAVATWMMNRNTLNIDQDPPRDCCLEPASYPNDPYEYQFAGTCGPLAPAGIEYVRIAPPLRMFTDVDGGPVGDPMTFGCGGSDVQGNPALAVHDHCDKKFNLAHELGHVVAMMRMGGRAEEQNDRNADLNQCMADYWPDGSPVDPGGNVRALFTKEYMSVAFREGWADFVSVWLWNRRTQSDCEMATVTHHDFDLDGTIDSTGLVDCVGTPFTGPDPNPSPMDDVNWLDDMESWPDSAGCIRDPDPQNDEGNRSTVYDVMRMYWNHAASGSMNPASLADLYVGTCPRGWAENDDEMNNVFELPLERLRLSADAVGIRTELDAEINHVEH